MKKILELCIESNRTVILCLVFFILAGLFSFYKMPREATPDIDIPIIYVSVVLEGIAPEDAERLLLKPLEKELKRIEGVKEMSSQSVEGMGSVTLEFLPNFDKKKALADVRAAVDLAEAKLPDSAKKPIVHEVSFAQFPVLIVGLAGDIPENALVKIARDLKNKIESIPSVLEVDIGGEKEDVLEIQIHPNILEFYNLNLDKVLPLITLNNKLIASGTLDIGYGRLPFKVPGVYETPQDVMNTPIKVEGDSVIPFKNIANIYKTFKDPDNIARMNGHSTIALYIKKRSGENIIQTVQSIKAVLDEQKTYLPNNLYITYMQDASAHILDMIRDLQNNLIIAVLLVMVVVGFSLGLRSTLLVGIAVPGSFLMGLLALYLGGVTINNVVLFSLILSIGMLVDGAIIVTEFADRKMLEGMDRKKAYLLASQRMIIPVIGSTLTTIAAFLPMLYWPGTVGKFLRYLPITVNCILTASLVMALIFIPTLGAIFGKPGKGDARVLKKLTLAETGNILQLDGWTGRYVKILNIILQKPARILFGTISAFILILLLTIFFGKGIEFFPSVEPDRIHVYVRMRGDFSIYEMDRTVKKVEEAVLLIDGIKNVYTQTKINNSSSKDSIEDAKGILEIEFKDWTERPKAQYIISQIKEKTKDIPGVIIEVRQEQAGPRGSSKPIQIQVSSSFPNLVEPELNKILNKMYSLEGLSDISDTKSLPGIEWVTKVDRQKASLFGANIENIGIMIRLLSNGYLLSKYRPDDNEDEVDIILRYPKAYRHFQQWQNLHVGTTKGYIPISQFVTFAANKKIGTIYRKEGERTLTAYADTKKGILPNDKVNELKKWIALDAFIHPAVKVQFKGEDQDQNESAQFLIQAFFVALGLITLILVAQFNSYYYTFLILTSVIFSTIGVMLGLLITGHPFCIIMNGIGIVSLAGVVVNNNIVLIDTYSFLKKNKLSTLEAVLRTGAQRLRPVLLTTTTTILGVIPMAIGLNINFIGASDGFITLGAPSTQWWKQLAVSISFGLAFATFLTLVLTPAMLLLGDQLWEKYKNKLNWILKIID